MNHCEFASFNSFASLVLSRESGLTRSADPLLLQSNLCKSRNTAFTKGALPGLLEWFLKVKCPAGQNIGNTVAKKKKREEKDCRSLALKEIRAKVRR